MGWFENMLLLQQQNARPFNEEIPIPGGPGPGVPPEVPTTPTGGGALPTGIQGALTGTNPWPSQTPGVLEGWDPTKWANPQHQSHKYKVGRILAKYPPTVEGLRQALPELQQAYPGAKILGQGDLDLGLGEDPVDVLRSASTGGTGWQWLTTDEARAASGGGLPGANLASNANPYGGAGSFYSSGGNSLTPSDRMPMSGGAPGFESLGSFPMPQVPDAAQPWTHTPFSPTAIKAQPGAPTFSYNGPGLPGEYGAPTPLNAAKAGPTLERRNAFTYDPLKTSDPFVMPTGQQALAQDPGYQFRLEQGLKARESSAAQRGLLRTGATLKGLDEFGQEMASQEYGKAFDRAYSTYGLNQGVRQSEQAQQFGQSLSAEQQNAAQRLNEFNAQLASQGQEFQQYATQQGMNEAQRLAAYNANLTRQQQGYGQGIDTARFNADNWNQYANRDLSAQTANQANLLAANNANNAFSFQGAGWNADQRQQQFLNQYNAILAQYGLQQAQNFARNQHNLQGYQTDVSRDLAQQGINLTAEQNARMFGLNAQQQQWMQQFMMQGQSFDQAYKMLIARLQYA